MFQLSIHAINIIIEIKSYFILLMILTNCVKVKTINIRCRMSVLRKQ